MSRSALKKELSSLTSAQLVEVILDAYSAMPQTKAYFDYYLNPDVDKLFDKYMSKVSKELGRRKYNNSKMRSSVISKALKEFQSFSPGADKEAQFIGQIISDMACVEKSVNFTPPQWNLVRKLVISLHDVADRGGIPPFVINFVSSITSPSSKQASPFFKSVVRETAGEYKTNRLS